MASPVPATVAPKADTETQLDPPRDLRELVESVSSLGSFGLRWQLFESEARWTAADEGA